MTISDMHTKLNEITTSLTQEPQALKSRLQTVLIRLQRHIDDGYGSYDINDDIAKLVKKFKLCHDDLSKIENYLNEVDNITASGIRGIPNINKDEEKTKKSGATIRQSKLIDLIPIIIAVVILAVGLGLGLTVFAESQDALYFALESIKDIVGSVVTYICAEQVVNHKKKKKNNVALIIVSTIMGLLSLVFSIVLWVASGTSLIERFTQWDKLTYLWIGLTLSAMTIVCAVSIVWYMLTYNPPKNGGKQ